MAGARRGAALFGAALSGLQPEADDRPQSPAPADRPPAGCPCCISTTGATGAGGSRPPAWPDAEVLHGPVLNRASMVIDAAIDGQGVALARTTLAASDLINGRLVRPFETALRLPKSYWIICPKAAVALPKISPVPDLAPVRGGGGCEVPTGARMRAASALTACRQESRVRRAAPKPPDA